MTSTTVADKLKPDPTPSRSSTPTPQDVDALGQIETQFVLPPLCTLPEAEYIGILRSIGATRLDDPSQPVEIASSSPFFPHRHLPNGLYKDIVRARQKYQLAYCISNAVYSLALILQLLLGAVLTALGSSSAAKHGLAITILAAANTVNAGLIALFNNTGMPDRFWNDWNEFEDVEMFVKELIETGLVETDKTKEQVVAGCFVRFQTAKVTVRKNKPASYNATAKEGAKVK
ncbi:e890a639-1a66-4387-a5ab-c88e3f7edd5f [Sclerotinia trifoliorum]|uniref:E890a639-1a66-4387-a5ab-c88e3f7edd5f n=1 Tax=Sclerotinia trifoliorum TaxID=28548 RepID=A0A8H2VPG1_9HELO|nr:e890a639-1a66-4387-a5ab-c88e3f7edd5f [Sclerotinia trifoliorum]